jgi:hypothetical protein
MEKAHPSTRANKRPPHYCNLQKGEPIPPLSPKIRKLQKLFLSNILWDKNTLGTASGNKME